MIRLLMLMLGMLTTNRVGGRRPVPVRPEEPYPRDGTYPQQGAFRSGGAYAADGGFDYGPADAYDGMGSGAPAGAHYYDDYDGSAPTVRIDSNPPWLPPDTDAPFPPRPGGPEIRRPGGGKPAPRRRRIPLRARWIAAILLVGLIFRRVIAFVVLAALSAALHLVGLNVHLPHIKFEWPWQTISAGTTTDVQVGPWVLQKLEGISKPALGTYNFNFVFTHKVSKNIGFWPCWYSSTFYAVGRASATVDLNPGPAWWTKGTGHYRLQVLSRPEPGKPGHVSVAIVLPQPQLPQSVHDIAIDNTLSQPIDTQHSWTYPGFGCGVLLKPQFSLSVLYSQAQNIAFYQATHLPQVTRPLISTAETQAETTIRNNFIQPTVNAFGYTLDRFTIRWAGRA